MISARHWTPTNSCSVLIVVSLAPDRCGGERFAQKGAGQQLPAPKRGVDGFTNKAIYTNPEILAAHWLNGRSLTFLIRRSTILLDQHIKTHS